MASDFGNWVKELGEVVKDGVGIFADVRDTINPPKSKATPAASAPPAAPAYNAGVTAGDFAFTPNWYLLGLGIGLLVLVMILRK